MQTDNMPWNRHYPFFTRNKTLCKSSGKRAAKRLIISGEIKKFLSRNLCTIVYCESVMVKYTTGKKTTKIEVVMKIRKKKKSQQAVLTLLRRTMPKHEAQVNPLHFLQRDRHLQEAETSHSHIFYMVIGHFRFAHTSI